MAAKKKSARKTPVQKPARKKVATPSHENPMLLMVILRAMKDPTSSDLEGAIISAIVHAWYEAHIEAEDDRKPAHLLKSSKAARRPIAKDRDHFPTPPFPEVDVVHKIVADVRREFPDDRLPGAAIAYGSALGWKAGHAEGTRCPGCTFRGNDPVKARMLRGGRATTDLFIRKHGHENGVRVEA